MAKYICTIQLQYAFHFYEVNADYCAQMFLNYVFHWLALSAISFKTAKLFLILFEHSPAKRTFQ